MTRLSEETNYLMPAHFGGLPGPPRPQTYHDVTTVMVSYETEAGMLSRLMPDGFVLLEPVVTVAWAMNREVDWLAGGGYNLVGVNVPVRHVSEPDLEGAYALVVWENRTCPIIAGREQTGIPKIFAEVEDLRRDGDSFSSAASYQGSAFLALSFQQGPRMSKEELARHNLRHGRLNWFGWRYIPNIGRPGAALSHATLYPIDMVASEAWRGSGAVEWRELTAQQNPTQSHIISALARLPVKGWREGLLTRGEQVLRVDGAREMAG